jgi:hypothetical protein
METVPSDITIRDVSIRRVKRTVTTDDRSSKNQIQPFLAAITANMELSLGCCGRVRVSSIPPDGKGFEPRFRSRKLRVRERARNEELRRFPAAVGL